MPTPPITCHASFFFFFNLLGRDQLTIKTVEEKLHMVLWEKDTILKSDNDDKPQRQ